MVDPPASTVDTLVCCETTAGSISIAVRSGWAPHGSRRFLDMVRSGYFSRHDMSDGPNEGKVAGKDDRPDGSAAISERRRRGVVPLMRCVDGFLCQFGLRGGASARYAGKIPDDAPWLPRGSSGEARRNPLGVRRFMNGYLAYAGSGPNSRGRQIFVTLADQSGLGNAPWEVPFAEVVGSHSYQTLASIYKGYGEYGPSQESLMTDSGLEEAREQFPKLDWIVSCDVVDEEAAEGFASGPKAREE
jgi:cyclophilin family peptidyl-prolyl cis-trans isomerase